MPLNIPPAPAAAERSLSAALQSTTVRSPHPIYLNRGALRPVLPLPVHRLTPVPDPTGAARSRLTGWRFLLESGGRAVGAAETMLTPDGWAFSHFGEGPYIASTERAVRRAEELPGTYQPRLLSIPELYMLTLWLHSDPTAEPGAGSPLPQDILVPLAPAPPGIAGDLPVRADTLLPVLAGRLTITAPTG
ncbi:hypothetical protein H7827_27305 [Streptomyces sp. JH002]|uniref:hypothetical protein n=1 Tax=Streptomyces TaxID=1883 RepID=UPI0021D23B9D|nr:hypothetical protein [Streptomyces sp. G-5]MCU4749558.1 hypothetical protein [Streptomyces sp. G-5]